jgi:SAM-dependent methyltransferase
VTRPVAQQEHWATTFARNPEMYGAGPSAAAAAAANRFREAGSARLLELGAGQGRDTIFLLRQGFDVVALDYVPRALDAIVDEAMVADLAELLTRVCYDAREPLPFDDSSVDASYSHMLFCMALTVAELEGLAAELHRVVRPGGLVVYTVRHTGDAHYGTGVPRGEDMYEHGGFIVHFFRRDLVERLANGFELLEVTDFSEGDLPRRLWRVTMRRP